MKRLLGVILFAICGFQVVAESLAPLRVQGRHLVDPEGKCVRLIGPMQSMCPFFSSGRWGDGQDDAAIGRCLDYMQKICHALSDRSQGSYLNMIRLTDDGYWSHDDHLRKAAGKDSRPYTGCDWARYRRYVEKVLVPATERAVAEGLYVVIRPSYNTEGDTMVGDGYNHHLVREWETIASQPRLKALAGRVLFELENEPVNVKARNGEKEPDHRAVVDYMQPLVDTIRLQGWKGIILVPGAGYQSHFQGFMSQCIRDPLKNYGFAVHVYPGWYGQNDDSADTERFVAHFLNQVPVARDYPCVVTECDWSPEKPGAGKKNEFGEYIPANWGSWGTGSTSRWGNAYLEMLERLGNVSTLIGGLDIYFNVDTYLKTGRFEVGFKGNLNVVQRRFKILARSGRWKRR